MTSVLLLPETQVDMDVLMVSEAGDALNFVLVSQRSDVPKETI